MGGIVVGDGAVVRAALVPHHDVVLLPLPPTLHVGVVETRPEETEEEFALLCTHTGDPLHEGPREIERRSPGFGMHADERMPHTPKVVYDTPVVRLAVELANRRRAGSEADVDLEVRDHA